ncbi:hypothetical protein Tco_0149141 [Tanacetum coccineum]
MEFKEITILASEATGRASETCMQTLKDLTPKEKIRKECDIRAANIIFHGLSNDMYTLLNHKTKAYDIWRDDYVNTKFVNHLQPEWGRFVTGVKQARNLHEYNPQVLVAAQQQPYIPHPTYEPLAVYQQPSAIYQQLPAIYQQASARPTSPDSSVLQRKGLKWFKEMMLLAQQPEAGIEIDVKQQDFLADGLEEFDSDCEDLQLNATSILMTNKVEAYDLDCDDVPTASARQSCLLLG